jgi:hypothetical protein
VTSIVVGSADIRLGKLGTPTVQIAAICRRAPNVGSKEARLTSRSIGGISQTGPVGSANMLIQLTLCPPALLWGTAQLTILFTGMDTGYSGIGYPKYAEDYAKES